MITNTTIITLFANAMLVVMLALAVHELLRPGKMLGFLAGWLWSAHEWLKRAPIIFHIYAFLTHSLRECFACLAGQIALLYFLLTAGLPHCTAERFSLAFFCAMAILFTYPLNKLFK